MIISPIEKIIAIIAPDSCYICGLEGSTLCEGCFISCFETLASRCYICNKLTKQNRICNSCRSSSRLRRVWWLGHYQGALKELVLAMKYQRKRVVARSLGEYLAKSIPHLPPDTLVTYIPTASSRIRRRGYDQSKLLAQALARDRGLKFEALLNRQGQADLVGKKRRQRAQIMQKSLEIRRGVNCKGRNVLIIDDVLTTGSSLEAAGRLLRQAGATHVDAAVVVLGKAK